MPALQCWLHFPLILSGRGGLLLRFYADGGRERDAHTLIECNLFGQIWYLWPTLCLTSDLIRFVGFNCVSLLSFPQWECICLFEEASNNKNVCCSCYSYYVFHDIVLQLKVWLKSYHLPFTILLWLFNIFVYSISHPVHCLCNFIIAVGVCAVIRYVLNYEYWNKV